jgi:hypothetical protein
MLADGGEAISDLAVLRDQPEVFAPVTSTATGWRVLDAVDDVMLDRIRAARAAARERAWLLRGGGRPVTLATCSTRSRGRRWWEHFVSQCLGHSVGHTRWDTGIRRLLNRAAGHRPPEWPASTHLGRTDTCGS